MSSHWHLKVTRQDGAVDRWCGDTFAEVRKTLAQYGNPAGVEARPLKNERGGLGSSQCRLATRMPKAD